MPKNFRKIPDKVRQRLQTFPLDDVVVACVKQLRPEDIAQYNHLGLRLENDRLILPSPAVPPASAGKYSTCNVEGLDKRRDDLPKIDKEFCMLAPSWNSGDYHLVCHTREVYQREFIPPKEVELSITFIENRGANFLVKFAIDQVINKHMTDFEAEVLYNLNILQENIGAADVFPSDATLEEYAATIHVDWELLPVGQLTAREAVDHLLQGKRPISDQQRTVMEQRFTFFRRLRPTHFISGTNGLARYFGAKYADDFIVFENMRYGNAIYIMFEDWQQLSQKSRIDLLKGDREDFERIEHRDGWERSVEAALRRYRGET